MRYAVVSAALLCAFFLVTAIHADEVWTGTVSNPGDWNDPGNWSGNAVPGTADSATVSFNSPNVASATLSTSSTILSLTVGLSGTNAKGMVTVDGGTLTVTTGPTIFGIGGGSGGTLSIINNGFVNISGGSFNNGRGSGTSQGSGTTILSSGTLQAPADVYFGGLANTNNASKGYYQQDDGVATLSGNAGSNVRVGAAMAGSAAGGQGTMILNGGTVNISSPNSIGLILGDGSNTFGSFSQTGGTLIFQARGLDIGRNNGSGSASFSGGNVTAGTIGVGGSAVVGANFAGQGTMIVSGTANVTMTSGNQLLIGAQQGNASANASVSNGTLMVQGGTLTVNSSALVGSGNQTNTAGKIANGTVLVSGGLFAVNQVRLGALTNANGYMSLSGGQANINILTGPTDVSSTGTFSFTGGTLKLRDGQMDVANNGGTFSPGGSGGVGTTGFADKNYTQSSGTLWIDISAGTFDTVTNGAGTASIAGTINVNTSDSLTLGQTFDVLVASLVSLDPNTLVTGTDANGNTFSASVVNSNTTLELKVTAAPEPAVLSTGILAVGWLLRRRHRRPTIGQSRRLKCA